MNEQINRNYLNRLDWNASEDNAVTDKIRFALECDVDTQIAATEFVKSEIEYQNNCYAPDNVNANERALRRAIANLFTSDVLNDSGEHFNRIGNLYELRESFCELGQFVEFSVEYPYSRTISTQEDQT